MYALVYLFSLVITSSASMGENPLSPCPAGFIPPECIHECHDGFYGVNCMSHCSASCLNGSCRAQNGNCYRCQVGYLGPMCAEKCRPGYHGVNCSLACPVNCLDTLCDPFSGFCLNCIDGYGGSKCDNVKRLQSAPTPAKQVSPPKDKNDHTVLYVIIIVVTVTLPVCTVSLWVCILKKKFKEMYYNRYLDRAASISPIYRNTKNDLPFLEANYGDALKTMVKQLSKKKGASPVGSLCKWPGKPAARTRDKNNLRRHAGAEGENVAAKAFSPEKNQDDLMQLLKKNNPVKLSQAANYTVDLFFKTPNPDLKPALESQGETDHPQETCWGDRVSEKAASPAPGDHERKAGIAVGYSCCRLKEPAIVADQKLHVHQYADHGNQEKATEQGDRGLLVPTPFSGVSGRTVKETTSFDKGTYVCDADLVQPVARPRKKKKSGFTLFRNFFSRIKTVGSCNTHRDEKPEVLSPQKRHSETPFADPPPEKVEYQSIDNRESHCRGVHKVLSCPVIMCNSTKSSTPPLPYSKPKSVPAIKQPSADVRIGNNILLSSHPIKTPRRTKLSRRCPEVADSSVNILNQSEAVSKTTDQRLVPWSRDDARDYSKERKYAGALSPMDDICDRRSNCTTPLPVQENNTVGTINMPEDVGPPITPLNPSITGLPLTSYFYASHCIEPAGGSPWPRCETPMICETIDMLNSTVNTQTSKANESKDSVNVSDDQSSSTFFSFRDSTKNSIQQKITGTFPFCSPIQHKSAYVHGFLGNRTAEDDRNGDSDNAFVNVDANRAPKRYQKRSTQTRLKGSSIKGKNVRTRMLKIISRDEVSPVLYKISCPSPGLVLHKTKSFTKCIPSGLIQKLTDQHVKLMQVAPIPTRRSSMRFGGSYDFKENVSAQMCQANEFNKHRCIKNDSLLLNNVDVRSMPGDELERESFYSTTVRASGRGLLDYAGGSKDEDCRGRVLAYSESLKRRESKPPKGMPQRTDKMHRKNHDSPVTQGQLLNSPDMRSSDCTHSPLKKPLNISRNNAPTSCCRESAAIINQETLGAVIPSHHRLNNVDLLPSEDYAHTSVAMSPKRLELGQERAFDKPVSNNTSGPTSPRDSKSFQGTERTPKRLRDSLVQLDQGSQANTKGDMPDSFTNTNEATDAMQTYAEAPSLHGFRKRRPHVYTPPAGLGGCESDFFLTNPRTFVHGSPCSHPDCELPSNQNNADIACGGAKSRSPNKSHVDFEDLTHNAVKTSARLSNIGKASVLYNNKQYPRLAIICKGLWDQDTRRLRKTRLSFPHSGNDKENKVGSLCKKPLNEQGCKSCLCTNNDLSRTLSINRVVVSDLSSNDSGSRSSRSSETKPVSRQDKGTCAEYHQTELALGSGRSFPQSLYWRENPTRIMLTTEEFYQTKDYSYLPYSSSNVLENVTKGATQSNSNVHFVLKSPRSRKAPRRMKYGRTSKSASPYVAPRYPMPSLLETVVQADDTLLDHNSRCALGQCLDFKAEPVTKKTPVLARKDLAKYHSCPLFNRFFSSPTSLRSAPQKVVLVEHGVNTAPNGDTVEAGCQCGELIAKADKSCLAKRKWIVRELRPEEITEYRSIIEGDSEIFYDALDYRDFESNTSKEQSDLTFTKSFSVEPMDKTELNGQKHKSRRSLLVDLMSRYQRSRCRLSKFPPASTTDCTKPPSKLGTQSSLGNASRGVEDVERHRTSRRGARLIKPRKKFALIFAPAVAKQARNASVDMRVRTGAPMPGGTSSKRGLKTSKHGPSGLAILACSWQAQKGADEANTVRAGEGSEGSSARIATGGNPKPVRPKGAERRHGVPIGLKYFSTSRN